MNITRGELVDQLKDIYGYSKTSANEFIKDLTTVINDNLKNGNTVSIRNLGVFDMVERKARKCPNPITGDIIDIPAHWVPKFFPSGNMKTSVKKWGESIEQKNKKG